MRGTVVCQLDEMKHDVVHNQILKATAATLSRQETISHDLKHKLKVICRRFSSITDIKLRPAIFKRVQLYRNNLQYAMLLRLCELVFYSLLPNSTGEQTRFYDVLRDEEKMSRVFEDFIRNFYYYEQNTYKVSAEELWWDVRGLDSNDTSLIPVMKTDVVLRSTTKIIIADAKFYAEPFPESFGTPKLRPDHLYQLYAYMKNASQNAATATVDGALIYVSPGGSMKKRYRINEHTISIFVVDLSRPWPEIHDQLLDLITDVDVGQLDPAPTYSGVQLVS